MLFFKPNVDKLRKKRDIKALDRVVRDSRLPEALRLDAVRALAEFGQEQSPMLRGTAADPSLPAAIRTNAALAIGQILLQQYERDGFIESGQDANLRFLIGMFKTADLEDSLLHETASKALAAAVEELHRSKTAVQGPVA